jgi:1,4-dihydroxy-2-naphthoate octaprenyltransferase/chlorophyll synthase
MFKKSLIFTEGKPKDMSPAFVHAKVASPFQKWRYALKIQSWPKILVPALLGHAAGAWVNGTFWWGIFWISFAGVMLGVGFIVLLNDWGDQSVDAIKRNLFPDGCSPKTIPDGILPANQLLWAGAGMGVAATTLVVYAALLRGVAGPATWWYALVCCLAFIGYTLPPLKLNYRGGGELMEMLGVGYLLPAFMAYLQSGEVFHPAIAWVCAPYLLLSLGSALASGLSDEVSDREGGKNTFTTWLGNFWVRKWVEGLVAMAIISTPVLLLFQLTPVPLWGLVPSMALQGYCLWKMRQVSHLALTNAFAAQHRYKSWLHYAIWGSGLVWALALLGNTL